MGELFNDAPCYQLVPILFVIGIGRHNVPWRPLRAAVAQCVLVRCLVGTVLPISHRELPAREAAISQRELAQLDMILTIQLCVLLGFVNGGVLMMSWTVNGIQF
jgi:hypothetical protein